VSSANVDVVSPSFVGTSEIRTAFEHREYGSAMFLDLSQAFNRVWLDGPVNKNEDASACIRYLGLTSIIDRLL